MTKRSRNLFVLYLAILACIVYLSGCGGGTADSGSSSSSSGSTTTVTTTTSSSDNSTGSSTTTTSVASSTTTTSSLDNLTSSSSSSSTTTTTTATPTVSSLTDPNYSSCTTVDFRGIKYDSFKYYNFIIVGDAEYCSATDSNNVTYYFYNKTILTSTDAVNWRFKAARTNTYGSIDYGYGTSLYGVAYGATPSYIAVGMRGSLIYSDDSTSWSYINGDDNTTVFYGVAYAGNTYVAVGANGVIKTVTSNGIPNYVTNYSNWTTANVAGWTPQNLYRIAYDNATSTFFAVGESGTLLKSTNGTNWSYTFMGSISNPLALYDIVRGDNYTGFVKYVMVGEAGTIYSSTDGNTWTSRNSGTTANLNGVAYGNNEFYVVGASGTLLHSRDGETWDNRTSGTTHTLFQIAYGSGNFVAVGEYGTVVAMPRP
ncbi:MAG: hypothetical protein HQK88_14190 [Nitrospirae bacterium]|nr:hypothetical protein [Nitrospirota bacterium]MBF0536088.1 hypothetical protein [Nitrospirota bacterium]MBF0617951.1 hypothetical protein [Nitrospirota bacterium]